MALAKEKEVKVYSVADYIVSPSGLGTSKVFQSLVDGEIALKESTHPAIPQHPIFAATFQKKLVNELFSEQETNKFTPLELYVIFTIKQLLEATQLTDFSRLVLLISTTKGNIELLDGEHKHIPQNRLFLPKMAEAINSYFEFPNQPMVISNACISGVSALLVGKRMIEKGEYDHAIVIGGDSFSHFVYSGFQSFMALSQGFCAPYDKNRDGINLGEGVGGIFLSNDQQLCNNRASLSEIMGGGQANDANHISGPSREGKGLKIAIGKALDQSKIGVEKIGYISAHGTATPYNDEMESIAFGNLGLGNVPLNSLKGYFGHTLGAAGILESILTIHQLNKGNLLKSIGFKEMGVSQPLNILEENKHKEDMEYALKTASGFGGGNAAIIFKKIWK